MAPDRCVYIWSIFLDEIDIALYAVVWYEHGVTSRGKGELLD